MNLYDNRKEHIKYNKSHIETKLENDAKKKNLKRAEDELKKANFEHRNRLVELDKIMIFTYPKGAKSGDRNFHLCEESADCKTVKFVNKDVDVPKNKLMDERNILDLAVYDDKGNPLVYYSNYLKDIARCDECESFVPPKVLECVRGFYEANSKLKLVRFWEVEELEDMIFGIQEQKNAKKSVQTELTFD